MKLMKQNDEKLYPVIQKVGCFFRSCGIIAELKCGKKLEADQINRTWDWARRQGYVDNNNDVRNSAVIATQFLRELGDDTGRFVEVGTFRDGVTQFYFGIRNGSPELCKIDALIQKIKQNGPSKYHFRVVDKSGKLLEDPHEPEINVVSVEYSILYAYTWN